MAAHPNPSHWALLLFHGGTSKGGIALAFSLPPWWHLHLSPAEEKWWLLVELTTPSATLSFQSAASILMNNEQVWSSLNLVMERKDQIFMAGCLFSSANGNGHVETGTKVMQFSRV